MFKPTPNPPQNTSFERRKLKAAAERAIGHYFPSSASVFTVAPDQSTEALLANASETFASLNALTSNLAFELEGSQRGVVLAIQQMSELGQLLVDQALEQVGPSSAP
jgi:hypothetical protein